MTLDMTRGKPFGLMIRFALPLMLSSLLQQVYTMCDSIIVGQLLGTEAFAAIGSCAYLHWFPVSMLSGLAQGFGVALAQRFGAKDEKGFRQFMAGSLGLTVIAGAALTILCAGFVEWLLVTVQTPQEVFGYCTEYLRVLWVGLMLTALLNLLSAALRARGDSRTPFVALLVSTVVNIALDYLLMAALDMGVTGAALATVISQGAAAGWCMLKLTKQKDALPKREDWKVKPHTIKELLRLGMPPMFSGAVISIGELVVQRAVNACGVVFLTGLTASRRYFSLLNIVGFALEGAVATYVGQNYGAKQRERILEGVRVAIIAGVIAALSTAALVIVFAEPLIRLFVGSGTPEMIQIGVDSLRVEALFVVTLYLLCEYRAAIQGMGNSLIPMLSGFLELVLRIACVFIVPLFMGREGLYFTDAFTWTGTALMLILSYYTVRKSRLIL